jgi:8-oxo-dGTP diphosphatase
MSGGAPVPCAGVVCLRGGEVLLIRRGQPPRLGEWSLPGGRIELGETAAAAALRELREETGVEAELLGLVDVVDHFGETGQLLLIDYAARWISGEPAAGDDAAEARFFPLAEAVAQVAWSQTRRIIEAAAARFSRRAPAPASASRRGRRPR